MAPSIEIRLAGTLEVQVDGVAVREALGPLGRVALAYLAVEHRRAVARDELADVLWGEDFPPHGLRPSGAWWAGSAPRSRRRGSTDLR